MEKPVQPVSSLLVIGGIDQPVDGTGIVRPVFQDIGTRIIIDGLGLAIGNERDRVQQLFGYFYSYLNVKILSLLL